MLCFNIFIFSFGCLRFDKDNKKGASNGYFLWLVIGYGIGKSFCPVFVLLTG